MIFYYEYPEAGLQPQGSRKKLSLFPYIGKYTLLRVALYMIQRWCWDEAFKLFFYVFSLNFEMKWEIKSVRYVRTTRTISTFLKWQIVCRLSFYHFLIALILFSRRIPTVRLSFLQLLRQQKFSEKRLHNTYIIVSKVGNIKILEFWIEILY